MKFALAAIGLASATTTHNIDLFNPANFKNVMSTLLTSQVPRSNDIGVVTWAQCPDDLNVFTFD